MSGRSRGHRPVEVVSDPRLLGERAQEREVHVGAGADLLVAAHGRDVAVVLRLRGAHRGDDRLDLVEGDGADLAERAPVGREQPERDEVLEVGLGRVVRRAEVGDAELDLVEHQRGREVLVRHRGGDVAPGEVAVREAVEVAHEQPSRGLARHRVGPGVGVAGARVEVHEEQEVDERRVEASDARALLRRRDLGRPVEQVRDRRGVVGRGGAGVPRLPGAVAAAVGHRGALPEVEERVHRLRRRRRRIDHPHDVAPEEREVGDRPEVAGVDLAAGTAGAATDLLRRHRLVDRGHHLRVAEVGLRARHDDVRGDGDQLRLEARALHRQRLRDGRVVGDEPVGVGLRLIGREAARHGARPRHRSSRARPRCRSRARPRRTRGP